MSIFAFERGRLHIKCYFVNMLVSVFYTKALHDRIMSLRGSMLWCPLRFPHDKMFGSFLLPVVNIGVLTSYLPYLCLFAYRGVQHILWCVFVLFFFVFILI
jgi:hypothetical protein